MKFLSLPLRSSGDEALFSVNHIVYVEESDQVEYVTLRLVNGYTIDISLSMDAIAQMLEVDESE